ncbi:FliM/FliN family flagellar motor switch protein [Vibrio sp. PNB22_3_1]
MTNETVNHTESSEDLNLTGIEKQNTKSKLPQFNVELTVELGGATLALSEVETLKTGSVVMLGKSEGDLADIKINNSIIGQGHIIEKDGTYGIQVVNLLED